MKFALVNGNKMEAEKGLKGTFECIGCKQTMVPICGTKRAWHWRHKVECECDHWWENETEWHRNWKNHFPKECQEIRHQDETTGEWHIADVKTKQGHILEFQHSFLKPEERQARNKFYGENLIWIVDGLAKKNDQSKTELVLRRAKQIHKALPLYQLPDTIDESPCLQDWSGCSVPVFFDFGSDKPLLCLLPKNSKGSFYVVPFLLQDFISSHNGGLLGGKTFLEYVTFLMRGVFIFENPDVIAAMQKLQNQVRVQARAIQRPIQRSSLSLSELNYIFGRLPPRHWRSPRL